MFPPMAENRDPDFAFGERRDSVVERMPEEHGVGSSILPLGTMPASGPLIDSTLQLNSG